MTDYTKFLVVLHDSEGLNRFLYVNARTPEKAAEMALAKAGNTEPLERDFFKVAFVQFA